MNGESTGQPIVWLRGVSKSFGARQAVRGVDLEVPRGGCFGLLGPNGAGKTTLLRMIYGVTRPTRGEIRVFGLDITRQARAVRARLGVTLQDNVMIDTLSPVDNLRIFGRYHRLREPVLTQRLESLMDFLDLRSHADVKVMALSGGFKRRLAVAMSLMNDPELLILDEPTTGLDPAVRQALWSRVRSLRTLGTTVLLTTHYMDEAERLCDQVAIMSEGRVIALGAPRALIERYLAKEVVEVDCSELEEARLLGDEAGQVRTLRSGGRLMLYTDAPAHWVERVKRLDGASRSMMVRPTTLEDVFLSTTGTHLEGGA